MGFLCCICQEDLERRKGGSEDGSQDNKAQERPIVTTKCGHLFHSNCLSSWFQKKGGEVWTKKECPVCRMSLTVATDLIRIFPSAADDGSPSVDDVKAHAAKMENYNAELSGRLEVQFLRGRDLEKKIQSMAKDMERLQKAYIIERQKTSNFQSEAAKFRNENEELRNVVINLNLKAIGGGSNGINVNHANNVGRVGPGYPQQVYTLIPQPGSTNLFAHGQPNNSIPQSHSPTPADASNNGSWPPSKSSIGQLNSSSSMQDIRDSFGSMTLNNNNNNNIGGFGSSVPGGDYHQQVQNSMFPIMGGLKSTNGTSILDAICAEREFKSRFGDDNSSSTGPESDCSREENDQGEVLGGGSPDAKMSTNSKQVISRVTSEVDQSPTDEMMDAILNSKPHTASQDNDQFVLQRNKYASTDLKKPKGKTKWKAVEYEENTNKKVYGKFYCENCAAKWGTARHIFNQAQTCMRCKESVFPYAQGPVMSKEELAQDKISRKQKS